MNSNRQEMKQLEMNQRNINTSTILDLPVVIFRYIRDFLYRKMTSWEETNYFLDNDDDFDYETSRLSWRNFLSISIIWKDTYRKQLFDMTLNQFYSLKYVEDSEFREIVKSRVESVRFQLCLNLGGYFNEDGIPEEYTEVLSNIYSLDLSVNLFETLPAIHDVYEINLEKCIKLIDVLKLRNIDVVNCDDCVLLEDASNLTFAKEVNLRRCDSLKHDFSCFKQARKLYLPRKIIGDELKNAEVKHLVISGDSEFRETPAALSQRMNNKDTGNPYKTLMKLESIQILLSQSPAISDLQHLPNLTKVFGINSLSLASAKNSEEREQLKKFFFQLTDISFTTHNLGEYDFSLVPNLLSFQFSEWSQPFDTRPLSNVKHIDMTFGFQFMDLIAFQNCISVDLSFNEFIVDASPLGSVKYLKLNQCSKLSNITGLGKRNIFLDLSECPFIEDVNHLKNVRNLKLDHCEKVENVSELGNIEFLSLRGCELIKDFSGLGKPNQKFLNLIGCRNLENKDLFYFQNVYELLISYCPQITDLSMLTGVKRLTAKSLYSLTSANLYGDFIKVDFARCQHLKMINIFGNIIALGSENVSPIINIFGSLQTRTTYFEYPFSRQYEYWDELDEERFGLMGDEFGEGSDGENDDDDLDEDDEADLDMIDDMDDDADDFDDDMDDELDEVDF